MLGAWVQLTRRQKGLDEVKQRSVQAEIREDGARYSAFAVSMREGERQ
jgi:hypothetical protein